MFYDGDIPRDLKRRFAAEDRPYFNRALALFKRVNPAFEPKDNINLLCFFLKEIINALKTTTDAKTDQIQFFSADNLLRSERIRDNLRPAVEAVRAELFGKTSAPFRTIEEASAWLEREVHGDEKRFVEAGVQTARIQEINERIKELAEERGRLLPGTLQITVDEQTLDVWTPLKGKKGRGAYYPFRTYPGTLARKLRYEVKNLEALSPFSGRAILFWILADVQPIAIVATIKIQGRVTARGLLAMYKTLPIQSGVRQKKLSTRNVEVIRFIDRLGGPPKERIMQFWRDATKAWNRVHRNAGFTSRDGLKKAYERSARKLPAASPPSVGQWSTKTYGA